jgi:hypothetical protein
MKVNELKRIRRTIREPRSPHSKSGQGTRQKEGWSGEYKTQGCTERDFSAGVAPLTHIGERFRPLNHARRQHAVTANGNRTEWKNAVAGAVREESSERYHGRQCIWRGHSVRRGSGQQGGYELVGRKNQCTSGSDLSGME